ncbi:MAG: hypothetical protein K0S18_2033 [Anaerocolumna sp.]|jgi:hypothetical protein|nr:hypothetical protein [Anaerocolumna sp.]
MGLDEEIECISLHKRMMLNPAGRTLNIEFLIREMKNIQGII